jgi:hypothetical protein
MDILYIIGAVVGAGTPFLAGLVWLIRLEGRINTCLLYTSDAADDM